MDLYPPRLLGRDRELVFLRQRYELALSGKGQVVFVSGEAGVGKTRLVEFFSEQLSKSGILVLRGYCLAELAIPYFPLAEALEKLTARHERRPESVGLREWLHGPRSRGPSEPLPQRDRMFEVAAKLLAHESSRNPILIVLDDLQWADSATLALLHYLARNTREQRLFLLGIYRSEELGELGPGKPHPLQETLRLMSREHLCEELELARLDEGTVKKIAASMLGNSSSNVLELIAKESGGNPFFAVESVRFFVEAGLLRQEGDEWVAGTISPALIPGAIYDVVARRLSRLNHEDRQLIDWAATMGEHFDPHVLASALKLDYLTIVHRFARIGRDTRLVVEDGDAFRFDHAKIREATLLELPKALEREMHRRIADSLLAQNRESSIDELAYHYNVAGIKERVIEFGLVAGERAKQRSAFPEAITYYTWVLESAGDEGVQGRSRERALEGRAEARAAQGLHEKALTDAQELLKLSKDGPTRIRAFKRCAYSSFSRGHFTESLHYVRQAESEPGEAVVDRLRIRALGAVIVGYRGDAGSAITSLEEIARSLDSRGEQLEYANTLLDIQEFEASEFRLEKAFESANKALTIYQKLGDRSGEMGARTLLGDLNYLVGDVEKAEASYSAAADIGQKLGRYSALTWIYLYWGLVYEAAGRYEDARETTLRGLESAKLAEAPYPETGIYNSLVRSYFRSGETEEGERAFARMNELFEEHSRDASLTLQAIVLRTRGFCQAVHRNWNEADTAYASALRLVHKGPVGPIHEAETRLEYANWLIAQRRGEEAKVQLEAALKLYEALGNRGGIERAKRLGEKSR